MNDCQGKALKEGCHEREWAQTGVSSTEKTNTKRNLAIAMTKSKSGTQTVTNGHVSQKGNELCCWRAFQHQRPQSEQDRSLEASRQCSRGTKTYDNRTGEIQ